MKAKILIPLILLLILTCAVLVSADAPSLTINTAEEFLAFAENCRLDSYSKDLTVSLTADIDLSGQDFNGIPIFCGAFQGNGHTVSGLNISQDGSTVGLFRYITDTATVSDLKVFGTVQPGGSRSTVGGIAGSNAGTIESCEFNGTVSGNESIGGIVGLNLHTGVISSCAVTGTVYGNHFVGGIAGGNSGILKGCTNRAKVNTELQQNNVNLSDITIDSLTGTEAAAAITDIGGIVGINSGSVRSCTNHGNVGYLHIGYNIGGIAGNQSGYIADCTNHGTISGRKEIGGIAGQLEPTLAIIYSTDTLQILQEQVNKLFTLTNQTAEHLQNTTSGIQTQIVLIQGELENAKDILNSLIPEESEPEETQEETEGIPDITIPQLPDRDSIAEAATSLQNSVTNILTSLETIYQYVENVDDVLTNDLQSISDVVGQMQATLNSSSENLGGSLSDISDADTEEITTSKITGCQNMGSVNADRNGGGIAGAIAFESDLDPEEDIEIFGDSSLNFSGAYRASITNCDNTGSVAVKKQHGGGIVGYATIGLVQACTNNTDLNCPDAEYIGGIAGRSDGYIRNCSVKNRIVAKDTAGGIAGYGATVSDCRSMAQVSGSENIGTVLGSAKSVSQVSGSFYMLLDTDIGAIDGISYDSIAQSLSISEFLALEELPEFYQTATITFVFADGSQTAVTGNTGNKPDTSIIPVLEEIDGCKGTWQGHTDSFMFDTVVTAIYDTRTTIVQSDALRDDGRPILLAEGSFTKDFQLQFTSIDLPMAENAIEGWVVSNPEITTVHYLPPAQWNAEDLSVMVCSDDGGWKSVSHRVEGSYLVFSLENDNNRFCVVPAEKMPIGLFIAAGGLLLLVIIATVIIISVHNRRKRKLALSAEAIHNDQNCTL